MSAATPVYDAPNYLGTSLPFANQYVENAIGGKMNIFIRELKNKAVAAASADTVVDEMEEYTKTILTTAFENVYKAVKTSATTAQLATFNNLIKDNIANYIDYADVSNDAAETLKLLTGPTYTSVQQFSSATSAYREIHEVATADTQCENGMGKTKLYHYNNGGLCWLCKKPLNLVPINLVECEHILNIINATYYLNLYNNPNSGSFTQSQRAAMAAEYAWSHKCCNRIKNNDNFHIVNTDEECVFNTPVVNTFIEKLRIKLTIGDPGHDCRELKDAFQTQTNPNNLSLAGWWTPANIAIIRDNIEFKIQPAIDIINLQTKAITSMFTSGLPAATKAKLKIAENSATRLTLLTRSISNICKSRIEIFVRAIATALGVGGGIQHGGLYDRTLITNNSIIADIRQNIDEHILTKIYYGILEDWFTFTDLQNILGELVFKTLNSAHNEPNTHKRTTLFIISCFLNALIGDDGIKENAKYLITLIGFCKNIDAFILRAVDALNTIEAPFNISGAELLTYGFSFVENKYNKVGSGNTRNGTLRQFTNPNISNDANTSIYCLNQFAVKLTTEYNNQYDLMPEYRGDTFEKIQEDYSSEIYRLMDIYKYKQMPNYETLINERNFHIEQKYKLLFEQGYTDTDDERFFSQLTPIYDEYVERLKTEWTEWTRRKNKNLSPKKDKSHYSSSSSSSSFLTNKRDSRNVNDIKLPSGYTPEMIRKLIKHSKKPNNKLSNSGKKIWTIMGVDVSEDGTRIEADEADVGGSYLKSNSFKRRLTRYNSRNLKQKNRKTRKNRKTHKNRKIKFNKKRRTKK